MNIFSLLIYWVTKPFGYLLYLCYLPLKDYGLAILMFTFLTRILLFPLAIKQQRSTAEMARMRPKMEALQKKYAKDQKKLQEATMALYQEEGYSPVSGCLPMLIQMPILMILYNVIMNPVTYIIGVTTAQLDQVKKFLPAVPKVEQSRPEIYYAKELADPHVVSNLIHQHGLTFLNNIHPINFNLFGIRAFDLSVIPSWGFNVYLLIPVLCYITMAISSWMNFKMNAVAQPSTAQNKSMNVMMTFFTPLISVFFSFSLPAAMGAYWIYTNVFMIIQVILLNKFYHPLKLAAEAEERAQKKREERLRAGLISSNTQKLLSDEPEEDKKTEKKQPVRESVMKPAGKDGHYTKNQIKKLNKQKLAAARAREEKDQRKDE